MKTLYKCLVSVMVVIGMIACDEQQIPDIGEFMTTSKPVQVVDEDNMKVTGVKFSDDYKILEIFTKLTQSTGVYDLSDTAYVDVVSSQNVRVAAGSIDDTPPELSSVTYIGKEEMASLNLKLLALVDLSLPQSQIDAQRRAVEDIKTLLDQHLYVAFMYGNNVSETYEATDYVIDNYFQQQRADNTYIYRAILMKMDEMMIKSDSASIFDDAKYKIMVVMSDGKTYKNDSPIDPKHFELQRTLSDKAQEYSGSMLFYYANFCDSINQNPVSDGSDANILQYMCKNLNGLYQTDFNWTAIENDLMKDFNLDLADYKLTYVNPDGKVFRGSPHDLKFTFYDKESRAKIASGSTTYNLGSLYNPIIVHGNSIFEVLLQGLLFAICILLLIYLVMQLLLPYIMYRIFEKKYVTTYTGRQMSFNGELVGETCYYCKAPFEEGDKVVAKCKHTMHKECWDENEYHCPEHGRHCKEGTHYYNSNNLFDSHNASFYLKWIIAAVIAGFVAWFAFSIYEKHIYTTIIQKVVIWINNLQPGTPETEMFLDKYGSHLSSLPYFGLTISFFVTLFLSYLTVPRRQIRWRLLEIFVRATIAGVLGYLCFLLGCIISIVFRVENNSFLIEWIPWTFMTCIIMYSVTMMTRIRIRPIFLLVAFAVGFLSMYIWAVIYSDSVMDYRVSLLMSFITYSVGVSLCIARVAPKSERYFLHVDGAIKEMDIALYKWLRLAPSNIVTIGKSVDCSIQLSWDYNSKVAPLQAEIVRYRGSLRLRAVEEGVYIDDKPLEIGKEEWLYHGRSFTIGKTTFTYIEKDV